MLHILLSDDERSERQGIRYLINKFQLPLTIAEAENGREALAYIKSNPVDILLTDIKMPYMNGLDLAKEVYLHSPKVKIIIFSAYGEFDYAKKALEANAVNYLLKPIEVDEFEKTMKGVIAQCEEEKKQQVKEVLRKEADQKQMLFQLLTGTRFQSNTPVKAADFLIGKVLTLINVETQENVFLHNEKRFLQLVKTYAPWPVTYANLYPSAAYLIVESHKMPLEEELRHFCRKLQTSLIQLLGSKSTMIIGSSFSSADDIAPQAAKINRLREELFEGDNLVVFTKEIDQENNYYVDTVERCRREIFKAIEDKNMNHISLGIQQLIVSLEREQTLSVVYMHHIFYDLIIQLYAAYNVKDRDLIKKRIQQVAQCSNGTALKQYFAAILEEVSHNQYKASYKEGIAQAVHSIIERDYGQDIGLEYIAQKTHLAPAYLSFLYKQETGNNIVKQLTDFRMNKAKELLKNSNMKIVDIAKKCGYPAPSYFNRLFKNLFALTPKQYREQ